MLRQSGEERASLLTQAARSYYYNDIHFGMTLLLLPRCGGGIHKQAVRVDPPARNKSELLSGGYLCFFFLALSLWRVKRLIIKPKCSFCPKIVIADGQGRCGGRGAGEALALHTVGSDRASDHTECLWASNIAPEIRVISMRLAARLARSRPPFPRGCHFLRGVRTLFSTKFA